MEPLLVKVAFISGLRNIVLAEIAQYPELVLHHQFGDEIFLELPTSLETIRGLKSITNTYIVRQDTTLHPKFINSHKSILGELVEMTLDNHEKELDLIQKKFKILSSLYLCNTDSCITRTLI